MAMLNNQMVTIHPSIPTIFHASPIPKNWDPKQAPSANERAIRIQGMSNLERHRFQHGAGGFYGWKLQENV